MLAAATTIFSSATTTARAADVSIVIDGQPVALAQPPIEQTGRVFVPLRGVFERLGASVVYDNGAINATGDGRTVSLRVGSHTAIIDGQQESLDQAPFVVGSTTYVPLRFISQALGAGVDYDDGNQTVSITTAGAPAATPDSVVLTNMHPAPSSAVSAQRPAVSAGFSRPLDPDTVSITLDGRDVSSGTYVSTNDFLFSPPYALSAGSHTVHVTGKTTDDVPLDQTWMFTTGGASSGGNNYISSLAPADGTSTSGTFTVSGVTMPGASVHIVAAASADTGGYLRVTTGSYSANVTADSSGNFSQQVTVNSVSGGTIVVRVISVAPSTNSSATATVHLQD